MRSAVVVMLGAISMCLGCAAEEADEPLADEHVGTEQAAMWFPYPSPHGVVADQPLPAALAAEGVVQLVEPVSR